MAREYYVINSENFRTFLLNLSKERDVYAPAKKNDFISYEKFDPEYEEKYIPDQIRASEPIKSFLTHSREKVDTFPPAGRGHNKQILVGVKNCDITSLAIQDFVFKDNDPKDPFYIKMREDTTIISCDCNLLRETCFCVALDITPYPEKGFDLNLSKEADDFIVEVGSEKGRNLIAENRDLFSKADETQIKNRSAKRESFKNSLKSQAQEKETPDKKSITGSIKKSYAVGDIWNHFASTCIECGGCNHCCPACHCFGLSDQKKDNIKARYKSWDACLYNSYARVAGGANPRRHLYERLRNRFDKKFEFFPDVLGIFGCTGCGRCIEACPGKIDIREVLKKIVQGK
ncbi:MAG: 4Fe-4S dicluster domain-containing protein [Candidatus Omnitrophica bacterium]|nr:4Fe-4S dicluster domain-containing protein [Candidatus Omnitrophota bacterium]